VRKADSARGILSKRVELTNPRDLHERERSLEELLVVTEVDRLWNTPFAKQD
jgi:hypothetical protein